MYYTFTSVGYRRWGRRREGGENVEVEAVFRLSEKLRPHHLNEAESRSWHPLKSLCRLLFRPHIAVYRKPLRTDRPGTGGLQNPVPRTGRSCRLPPEKTSETVVEHTSRIKNYISLPHRTQVLYVVNTMAQYVF